MKRWLSIAILLLFTGSMDILPFLHRTHCGETAACDSKADPSGKPDRPSHQADSCPLCQLASAPFSLLDSPPPAVFRAHPVTLVHFAPDHAAETSPWLLSAPPTGPPARLA